MDTTGYATGYAPWIRSRSGVRAVLVAEFVHRRDQGAEQVTPSRVPAPGDEIKGCPRLAQRGSIGAAQERGEVHPVLWSRTVVAREHLQGNEMTEACDRQREARDCLDPIRRRHDLQLDSGRGEEQVDHRSAFVRASEGQPDRREAPRGALLDCRDDSPTARLEVTNEPLGILIVGSEHGEIGVTREAGLGARRDRQATDQGEPTVEIPQILNDATEDGFGVAQERAGGQEMGRPQPSPCSAPGRVWSQVTSRDSISSSVASGCSRRS
jgi:hypothetical protein